MNSLKVNITKLPDSKRESLKRSNGRTLGGISCTASAMALEQ